MESNWKGPVKVDIQYILTDVMVDGGLMELKFICPLCNEEWNVEGEVPPPKLNADKAIDSQVYNNLDTFICSCGNEFEITILNNMHHVDVSFEGKNLPKEYWYKTEHPNYFLDDELMELTLEEIMGEEEVVLKHKKDINDYLKTVIGRIELISKFDISYTSKNIDIIFPIVDFLIKENSIDESIHKYYNEIFLSSEISKDNALKESIKDLEKKIDEGYKKIINDQFKRINLPRSVLEKKLEELSNEKEFQGLLMAILPDLGFENCELNHGVLESGKDIIGISYDNFRIPEGNAFVIKLGKIGKNVINDIINQIRECSYKKYTHPNLRSISIKRIYVVTNETFSPHAKDAIEKETQSITQMISFIDKYALLERTKNGI